jgi:hypothetical protein
MKNHTMQFFLTLAFLVFILIMQAQAAKASSVATNVTYYLENNATIQSVGFDGNTNYLVSGTKTSTTYKNLLKNGTMGTQSNINYFTPNSAQNTAFQFYLPFNYSVDTLISANSTFAISWQPSEITDNMNVSLIDYNPANGVKTVIGNTAFASGTQSKTTFNKQINHGNYTVTTGRRLLFRINITAATGVNEYLYFNDISSYIKVTETNLYAISGYVTNTSGLSLSGATVKTNTSLTTTTNASGFYNFADLSNGTYIITANLTGYINNSTTVTLNGASNTTANITLQASPPTITSFAPVSPINDTSGAARTFNITANQTVNVTWYINGTSVQTNTSMVSASYTNTSAVVGVWNVTAIANNTNGTASQEWLWNVSSETIDVTLSNVPVNFGNVSAGSSNQPGLLPLNVTIQNTTNVNVNLTLNGSSFTYGAYSFGVGNVTYSNSSTGTKTSMATSFPLPPYADWINIAQLVTTNRSIYLWIGIPPGQYAGAYSSTINVRVEKYS